MQTARIAPARSGTAILILLVLSVTVNYLDRGALSVSAPQIASQLSISTAQMGVLFSAFFWTYSCFQLVAGWLVDRFSIRWVYAAGYLVWSAATAAVGIVDGFSTLLVTRLVLGAGESVAYPAASKLIVSHFPEQRRGLANAMVDAASKIGPALSTLAGGLIVHQYGWRALFVVLGLASLGWLIPWLLLVPAEPTARFHRTAAGPGWGTLLSRKQVWGTSIGMFALGYMNYFLLSWLPSYLVQERGFSFSSMAALGSIPFWAMALASIAGGWSSDRLIARGGDPGKVRKTYAVAGLLLCGVAIVPVPLVQEASIAVGLITVACMFLGMFTSNVWAITQTLAGPAAAGKWTGLQNAIGNLGGVASPLATGWIVAETGSFAISFWLAAGVLALGAVAYLLMLGDLIPEAWEAATA